MITSWARTNYHLSPNWPQDVGFESDSSGMTSLVHFTTAVRHLYFLRQHAGDDALLLRGQSKLYLSPDRLNDSAGITGLAFAVGSAWKNA